MSEETTQVKISIPLIDDIELHRIDNFYNDIVSEYTKAFVKEKEQVIIQRLMMNLQQENKQLKEVIDEAKKSIDAYLDGQFSLEPDYAPDFFVVNMLEEMNEILNKAGDIDEKKN